MIVTCTKCAHRYDDEFRTTICPHQAFFANDGHNNFHIHDDSYYEALHEIGSDAEFVCEPFPWDWGTGLVIASIILTTTFLLATWGLK